MNARQIYTLFMLIVFSDIVSGIVGAWICWRNNTTAGKVWAGVLSAYSFNGLCTLIGIIGVPSNSTFSTWFIWWFWAGRVPASISLWAWILYITGWRPPSKRQTDRTTVTGEPVVQPVPEEQP